MPPPPADAPLGGTLPPEDQIPHLAALYDAFANAFDPFSEERDQAERVFNQEVANWYDRLGSPRPEFQIFRRAVIIACRRYLKAERKPPTI